MFELILNFILALHTLNYQLFDIFTHFAFLYTSSFYLSRLTNFTCTSSTVQINQSRMLFSLNTVIISLRYDSYHIGIELLKRCILGLVEMLHLLPFKYSIHLIRLNYRFRMFCLKCRIYLLITSTYSCFGNQLGFVGIFISMVSNKLSLFLFIVALFEQINCWIICWYCRTSLLHEKAETFFSHTESTFFVRHPSEYETSDNVTRIYPHLVYISAHLSVIIRRFIL